MTDDQTPVADARTQAGKSIRTALVIAGAQLGGALLLTLAHKQGLIDSETTTRGVMVLIGLMLVVIGNAMPKKQEGPASPSLGHARARQSILRVGGWALTLGGLVWIAFWLFAPRDMATLGSVTAVAAASLVMVGYAIWRFRRLKSTSA